MLMKFRLLGITFTNRVTISCALVSFDIDFKTLALWYGRFSLRWMMYELSRLRTIVLRIALRNDEIFPLAVVVENRRRNI